MRVFVTDGETRAALAIVRSLGAKGHRVIVGGTAHPCLAGVSRYCASRATYPDPRLDEEGFIAALHDVVERETIEALLPVTDVTTLLVTEHRGVFPRGCTIPFAPHGTLEVAADKLRVLQIARSLGVPVPETVVVRDAASVPDVPEGIFPCAVKSTRSRIRTGAGWVGRATEYAGNLGELHRLVAAKGPEDFPLMVQQRVQGPGIGTFYCYRDGKAIVRFAHRRIREKPPSGGVSVLRESVVLAPDIRKHSEALLDALAWHGVAMVEFKIDRKTGVPVLMEINGRFWGSLQLAIDAGMDFPNILLDTLVKGDPPPAEAYRVGVRTRWLWGDVDSLLAVLFKSRSELQVSDPSFSRLRYLGAFLRPGGRLQRWEVLSADDVRPWLLETKEWFRRLAG